MHHARENTAAAFYLHTRFDDVLHRCDPDGFSRLSDVEGDALQFFVFQNDFLQLLFRDIQGTVFDLRFRCELNVLNEDVSNFQSHFIFLLHSDEISCFRRSGIPGLPEASVPPLYRLICVCGFDSARDQSPVNYLKILQYFRSVLLILGSLVLELVTCLHGPLDQSH